MQTYHFTGGNCGTTDIYNQTSTERWPPDLLSVHKHREVQRESSDTLSPDPFMSQSEHHDCSSASCHSLQLRCSTKNRADTFPLMLPVLGGRQDRTILLQECILFHVSPALSFAEPDVLDQH